MALSVKVQTSDMLAALEAAIQKEKDRVAKVRADWPKTFEEQRKKAIKKFQEAQPNQVTEFRITPPDEVTNSRYDDPAHDIYGWRKLSSIVKLRDMVAAETRTELVITSSNELAAYLGHIPKK